MTIKLMMGILKSEIAEETTQRSEDKEQPGIRARIKTYTDSIKERALGALRKIKERNSNKFHYSIEDIPEGEEGIEWVLEHREEVFPCVKKEIQFDNGGAPSQSRFYSEATARHSKFVGEEGSAHWETTNKKYEEARGEAAKLIGASPKEIAFEENTIEGIRNVVDKFDWQPGDKIIVCRRDKEYPTNFYPWEALKRQGIEIIEIGDENGFVTPEEIDRVLKNTPGVRLVTVSSVGWKTGQRVDLEGVGKRIAEANEGMGEGRKTRFFVDAIQSLGQHEVDVKKANIDFLAAGGSKWLLAGSGRGIFYCSQDALSDIRPEGFGSSSFKDYHDPSRGLKDDATIFEEGMKNFESAIGLGASISLVNRIGIENIERRIEKTTDFLCERLAEIGYEVASPRDQKSKSGMVLFRHPTRDSKEINDKLQETDNGKKPIWMSIRDEKMRACVHYYNTEEEIEELITRLKSA